MHTFADPHGPPDVARESVDEIAALFDGLWPILRSITGDGVRQTHDLIGKLVPLTRIEVPSGTSAFDWTVPPEWVVREAYVVRPDGERMVDVASNNLHLLNYSAPFRGEVSRAELDEHLYSLPDLPDAIPYVTSYYRPRWGFCIAHHERERLPEGTYQVVIDTELRDSGSMTMSEAILAGRTDREVMISTYTCHPSMANNELSGPLVAAFLYRRLAALPERRHTYRFVFVPETIGSITYLSRCGTQLINKVDAGLVLTCIGDSRPFSYKRSRRHTSAVDRAAIHVLRQFGDGGPNGPGGNNLRVVDFSPLGSDERQYCSPASTCRWASFPDRDTPSTASIIRRLTTGI